MSSPFATYPVPERSFMPSTGTSTPTARGGASGRGTGAKRGRKPKNANADASRTPSISQPPSAQPTLSWADSQPGPNATQSIAGAGSSSAVASPTTSTQDASASLVDGLSLPGAQASASTPAHGGDAGTPGPSTAVPAAPGAQAGEEDDNGEDELLPAMADDDYSAQLSWQSQSKDNLKVLMDNLSPAQYDRFEAYRRYALSKQAVRKVIQQTTGNQVSLPVAQIIAGFAKVFVGEMVEKAKDVQERRQESGPLSPDHLREAYRTYQNETGRVGAARPLRGKRLFNR
ncbi:Transcription initiation factor TFIID subunit 11 [Trametes pubescens]|uniref:Transcription initiation factor TFIID subunit 11 n=1 Tax=Trametes pubescens TaxID=154538 RepID=A0A1M2VGP4_TRAPU|nr:Transcription initiation factor TFIID subunit 11 [Trametes pubescens]